MTNTCHVDITPDFIKKVAHAAKLNLSDEEIAEFTPQLGEILKACETLAKFDTNGVTASFHPIQLRNRMREDEVKPSLSQEEALSLVKNKKDGYFKGPKVV